jgi:hypothetical protein
MIKFAVGYNRRGIDETVTKTQKNGDDSSTQQALMDRGQCFKVVAAAVKSVSESAIVDLKSPEVSLNKSWNNFFSLSRFLIRNLALEFKAP